MGLSVVKVRKIIDTLLLRHTSHEDQEYDACVEHEDEVVGAERVGAADNFILELPALLEEQCEQPEELAREESHTYQPPLSSLWDDLAYLGEHNYDNWRNSGTSLSHGNHDYFVFVYLHA